MLRRRAMMGRKEASEYDITPELFFGIGGNPIYTASQQCVYMSGTIMSRGCAYMTKSVNGAVRYRLVSHPSNWTVPAYSVPIIAGYSKFTIKCASNICSSINVRNESVTPMTVIDNGHWSSGGGETYDLSQFISEGATHLSIGFRNTSNTGMGGTVLDSTTVKCFFHN